MTVYVLSEDHGTGANFFAVDGVFSSRERAEEAKRKREQALRDGGETGIWFEVNEFTIDVLKEWWACP